MERDVVVRLRALIKNLGCSSAELAALVLLLAGATVVLGLLWWNAQPRPDTAPAAVDIQPSASQQPTELGFSEGAVVVHISGAVASPGVVELPAGARAHDAITAGGGPLPDAVTDDLNLARVLRDGEQVYVPSASEAPSGESGGQGPAGRININRADAAQLETLPGVGPVLAERVIAHREANGPFAAPEDLLDVSGIGEKTFEALADLITV